MRKTHFKETTKINNKVTKSRQEPFRDDSWRKETPRERRYRLRNERKNLEIYKKHLAWMGRTYKDDVSVDEEDFKVYKIFPHIPCTQEEEAYLHHLDDKYGHK